MKAILLAAGIGSRLNGVAGAVPKCLVPVQGKPVLQRNIEWLADQGVTELAVNLHHLPELVQEFLGDGRRFGVSVYYSFEPELLGTAGAVSHLRGWLDHREFVVLYADNIIRCDLHAMIKKHKQLRRVATLALYWRDDTSASGVVDVDTTGLITRFMEKPENGQSVSHWVFAGLVVCTDRVFREIPCDAFSDFGRDVFPALLRAGYELGAYELSEGETLHWIDTPADLLSTIDAYAKLERQE